MRKSRIPVGLLLAGLICGFRIAQADTTQPDALLFAQKALQIPASWALVTDAAWPIERSASLKPDYILIQDVHRNPEVQARITALILHGYQQWGVRKVFMEGAFKPLDLSLFHRIPKSLMPALVQGLVRDGDLSGPEVAAVRIMESEWSNPPVSPFQLFGLEDPELYRRNVLAYRSVLQRRPQALNDLDALRINTQLLGESEEESGHGLDLIEKLLRLKLTPKEWEVFVMYKDAAPSLPALDSAIEAASQYYQLARLRSRAFMKRAAAQAPASNAPRILVVGGFHTADMAALLRRQHRSFIVLSPIVASSSGQRVYQQRMRDTVQTYTDALSTKTPR